MEEAGNNNHSGLSKAAVKNTFWAYLSFIFGHGLTFVATIILARLLAPEQFGLMAFCLITMRYVSTLHTFGMGTALISRRDKIEQAANAAFVFGMGTSLLLFGFAWIIAPAIAAFFQDQRITSLFRALAVSMPISALGLVPQAMIRRSLRFKAKLIPDIGYSLTKGVCSIILASTGFGVWSLVLGQIAGRIIGVLCNFWVAPWRPTFLFERQVTKDMLTNGSHLISVGLSGTLRNNIDYLFVGRLFGAAALGYYTLAYRIPELVIQNLNVVVGKVALSLLSQLQTDVRRLQSVYFSYIRYIALFTFPAGIGLALTASIFIRTFYTTKWDPAIFPSQCIALALAISSVGLVPGVLYKAINKAKVLNQINLIKLPITIAVLWYAARWGVNGVAVSQIFLAIFYVTVDSLVVNRILNFQIGNMIKALTPALAGAAAMSVTLVILMSLVTPSGVAGLILVVMIGIGAYASALVLVSRDVVLKAYTMLRAATARP
jgi:O-antigen/teichoic acid export membrane protein